MEWLKAIFDRLLSIFPRILILTPYESGIRMTFGKHLKRLNAGWYLFWPIIQRIAWMEIQTQVVDLRTQSVRTKDNYDIIISGAIQYSIKDVEKAIVNVQDVDKSIETLSLGIILEFVRNKSLDDCRDLDNLRSEILKGLKEAAKGWGLKIEKIFITDLGKARNLRLLSNNLVGVK